MGAFYLSAGLQFLSMLLLGWPVALALSSKDRSAVSVGWLLLAPALGVTVYLSVGTILHSFGLRSTSVFWSLLVVALVSSCVFYRVALSTRDLLFKGAFFCLLGGATGLALNCADFSFAGLDYFPLTNGDTFSYLGHIDQIRSVGWNDPRMSYPAGYFPLIEHAVFTRTPGVILIADLADVLRLETHSSFFVMQRVALPIIALGAAGIVILVTWSLLAALLCFVSLTFGNVLLHQILQQFNSSTIGTVIAPVIVAVAIWTFRPERSDRESWVGCALAGWACGTMAITSMEAHPFYLIAFAAMAAVSIITERNWTRAIQGALAFGVLYVVSSFTFLMKVWPALINQFKSADAGHPGDWIACPGFLMQASGVTLTTSDKLADYSLIPRIAAFAVLASVATATAVLILHSVSAVKRTAVAKGDLVSLVAVALVLWLLQVVLYARGSGYALLKVTDYFAFVGAVVVSVASFQLGLTKHRVIGALLVTLIGSYCIVAFIEKGRVLDVYRDRTRLMPLPVDYSLGSIPAGAIVTPDLSAEPLNLFLYENRNGSVPISFGMAESNRFGMSPANPPTASREIVRVPRAGALGIVLADITYPGPLVGPMLTVISATGQTHLVQPDPHWLAPGIDASGSPWRWLSQSGRFVVYGPVPAGQRVLQVMLRTGPDLRPDNHVEIYLSGQRLLTVSPDQLPLQVEIGLPELAVAQTEGEIRIIGPATGIHQLSVAKLLSIPR